MKNYLFIVLLILLTSCQEPPLPPVIEGEPFFRLSATLDGATQDLTAGKDNRYLFTSYNQDQEDVYRLVGNIRPADCESCGPQLTIVFRDLEQRSQGSFPNANEVLQAKRYDFLGSQEDTVAYETRFTAEIKDSNDFTFLWDLGDGSTQTQKAFTHSYNTFPRTYPVHLTIQNATCSSEISQRIDVPKAACFPDIAAQFIGNETEHIFDTSPLNGLSYAWDLGDGSRKAGASIKHSFPARGAYTVCVLATSNDCRASHCRNIEVGEVEGCAVNFSYETTPVVQTDQIGLGEIEVYWTDKQGVEYSSTSKIQPVSSFFEVLEVAPYDENEMGDATFAFSFSLTCKVYAGNEERELKIVNGTMAVAYPE